MILVHVLATVNTVNFKKPLCNLNANATCNKMYEKKCVKAITACHGHGQKSSRLALLEFL